jgi:hypothetical protein
MEILDFCRSSIFFYPIVSECIIIPDKPEKESEAKEEIIFWLDTGMFNASSTISPKISP